MHTRQEMEEKARQYAQSEFNNPYENLGQESKKAFHNLERGYFMALKQMQASGISDEAREAFIDKVMDDINEWCANGDDLRREIVVMEQSMRSNFPASGKCYSEAQVRDAIRLATEGYQASERNWQDIKTPNEIISQLNQTTAP